MSAGVPAEAITAAAKVIHSLTCGECDYHADDLTLVSAADREDAGKVLEAAAPAIAAAALTPVYDWLVVIGFPFDFHFTGTRPAWMDLRELAEAWHRSDPSDDVETWLHGICMETEWMATS